MRTGFARLAHPARAVPAICLLALMPLAGCSDSDNDTASTTSTTEAVAPTSTASPVNTTFTGQGSAQFCQYIATYTANSQTQSPTASNAEVEASLREGLTAIDQAVAVAPAEIKADVVTVADTFDALVTAMAAADFDVSRMEAADVEPLQSPAFTSAATRMQAYLTTVCKATG
ncbi:MAG: hypothetical protein QOE93_1604 [Actinomycetota bacterium]|jgi:hypothetical protein|nr:hypothetical protein [Actinomycetota bacterium]